MVSNSYYLIWPPPVRQASRFLHFQKKNTTLAPFTCLRQGYHVEDHALEIVALDVHIRKHKVEPRRSSVEMLVHAQLDLAPFNFFPSINSLRPPRPCLIFFSFFIISRGFTLPCKYLLGLHPNDALLRVILVAFAQWVFLRSRLHRPTLRLPFSQTHYGYARVPFGELHGL